MKKSVFTAFLLFFALSLQVLAQDNQFIPKLEGVKQRNYKGYSIGFNTKYKLAAWVAYELTVSELVKEVERDNLFRIDSEIPENQQNSIDSYKGSGYDRGHLAPAADMSWSTTAMVESFYMTNMAPQLAAFNRGIWKEAEELVRSWANEYSKVYVISGCMFNKPMYSMSNGSGVQIPHAFYKIVARKTASEWQAIAFEMPNKNLSGNPRQYVTNIDAIELATGIDFFSQLDDEVEAKMERSSNASFWNWNLKSQSVSKKSSNSNQNTKPVQAKRQCKGITQKGDRCKNQPKKNTDYCGLHD